MIALPVVAAAPLPRARLGLHENSMPSAGVLLAVAKA